MRACVRMYITEWFCSAPSSDDYQAMHMLGNELRVAGQFAEALTVSEEAHKFVPP